MSETEESINFSALRQIDNFHKLMEDVESELLPVMADIIQACEVMLPRIDELAVLLEKRLSESSVIRRQQYDLLKLKYDAEEFIIRGYMYMASVMEIELYESDGGYKSYLAADRDWVDALTLQGHGKTKIEAINDLISKKGAV